jgi:hypothetical protein
MLRSIIAFGIIALLFGCKSTERSGKRHATKGSAMASNTPMTCIITGRVINIFQQADTSESDICSKHPCSASVKVMSVGNCGSGFSYPLNESDTVNMRFAFTLDATKDLFPNMKVQYPGLISGTVFRAKVIQRLQPGSEGEIIVYGYEIP